MDNPFDLRDFRTVTDFPEPERKPERKRFARFVRLPVQCRCGVWYMPGEYDKHVRATPPGKGMIDVHARDRRTYGAPWRGKQ